MIKSFTNGKRAAYHTNYFPFTTTDKLRQVDTILDTGALSWLGRAQAVVGDSSTVRTVWS